MLHGKTQHARFQRIVTRAALMIETGKYEAGEFHDQSDINSEEENEIVAARYLADESCRNYGLESPV